MSHDRYSMRTFAHRVAAVLVALALIAAGTLGAVWLKWGRGPSVRDHSVLVQPVDGSFPEYPPGGITSGIFTTPGPTLHTILDNLAKAARDDRVDGVVLIIGSSGVGYAMLEEIRSGIAKVRAAGKPVWAWGDMLTPKGLYLASACDSLFLLPTAYVELKGMYGERLYVTGTLDKLGIRPQITRIEGYKSAAEMVTRTDMSPQAREEGRWLMNDIYPRVTAETAEGLGLSGETLAGLMERTLLTAGEAVEAGLAHGLRHWDEMTHALPRPGADEKPRLLEAADYAQVKPADVGLKGKKKIAVVHAEGMIGGSHSGMNPLLGALVGHETVRRDLEKAAEDDDVAAIVFRVNSPGGESITSDRISRAVERANRDKPVIVSMVDVAASGGYSISYRARSILADANTITGSIGSITGKFNLRGLYDRLGVTKDGMGIGPSPGFDSDYRDWTPEEMEKVVSNHWAGYEEWIADIARHRDLSVAEVDSLARGRVWTGAQAVENGLIDEVGGLDRAVALAKEEAGLAADQSVTLVHYPQPEGFLAELVGLPLSMAAERMAANWVWGRLEETTRFSRSELRLAEVPVP
jgi:protease-4